VGRDAELQKLRDIWEECVREGLTQPRLIGICGEAGMGKSRLLREFENWFHKNHPQCLILKGRAQPYGNQPYSLFASLIQNFLKLDVYDKNKRITFEKGLEDIAAYLPQEKKEEFLYSWPILGHLVGIKFDDPRLQYLETPNFQVEIQIAVRSFLHAIISRSLGVTIVQLEDLHWVDYPSLQLLNDFCKNKEYSSSFLIFATYREHYTGLDGCEELNLKPLNTTTCENLTRAILGGNVISESILNLCVERAAGNPLFLEEIVQFIIKQDGPGHSPSISSMHLNENIPGTLMGVLLAKTARLDPNIQQILQIVAVFGHEFSLPLLERVTEKVELSLESLPSSLESLVEEGIIFCVSGENFHFKHALIREAAYETLLPADRQILHELTGKSYEELFSESIDEHVFILADHFIKAIHKEKAIHYIIHILRQHHLYSDSEQGLSLGQQGLELIGEPVGKEQARIRMEILRNMVKMHFNFTADYSSAHKLNEELIDLGERFDRGWMAEAYALEVELHKRKGNYYLAEQSLTKALALRDCVSDSLALGYVFSRAADVSLDKGEYQKSIFYAKKSLDIYTDNNDEFECSIAHFLLGHSYLKLHDLSQAELNYQKAQKILEGIGARVDIAGSYDLLGNCRFLCGDIEGAIQYKLRAFDVHLPIEKGWSFNILLSNIAQCYFEKGDIEQAEHYYQESFDLARKLNIQDIIIGSLYSLSQICLEKEPSEYWEQALQMADEIVKISEEIVYPGGMILGLSRKAMSLHRLGQNQEAIDLSQKAVDQLDEQGQIGGNHEEGLLEERIFFDHFRILHATGSDEEAIPYLMRAHNGLMKLADEVGNENREAVLSNLRFHRDILVAYRQYTN